MVKHKKYVFLILAFAVILLPVFAFSPTEEYKTLDAKNSVPAAKEFVISFETPISKASINSSNIYVMDSKKNKAAIEIGLSSTGKELIIKPLKPYENDQSYTLYIGKALKYETGKALGQGLKMSFSIAPYKEGLPVVASRQKLMQLLEAAEKEASTVNNKLGGMDDGALVNFGIPWMKKKETAVTFTAQAPSADKAAAGEYSGTNLQVQGVDEADLVKTDGEYIYQVSKTNVIITKAYPADKLQVVKTIKLEEAMEPLELYVDEQHMIVIGHASASNQYNKQLQRFYYVPDNAVMKIYDITDKRNIREVREIVLEGSYLSSRKIGSELYLLTNKYINYPLMKQDDTTTDTPLYRDSLLGQEFIKVNYDDIRYFPDSLVNCYMIAAGLSLDVPNEKLNVSTYLGAGEEIYCSEQSLYAAVTRYSTPEGNNAEPIVYDSAVSQKRKALPSYSEDTMIYSFALNRGKLEYAAKGMVPGKLLNQFSMDEYEDTFRIATTTGEIWRHGEDTSKNNLFILDKELKQLGEIRDIAPGEKIYSVRFMGDRAYMVTFRTVDPLFVIDLKDKAKPKIMGALKIPGYSDYLHPYDENHIIGFGKDTVEGNGTAYYLGMKIAMFDITDVTKPKELYVEKIGDRGTESPLLRDHKALLFSKERNLMAFPVTLMETSKGSSQYCGGAPEYGSFSFQGAYVYKVDLQKGFQLKGTITHISQEEYSKASQSWYDSDKNINRILYIGDNLYTVSDKMIKANDIESLKEINSLELK